MSVTEPAIPAVIAPRRAVGGISATVTIEEVATDDLEITQHPVQQGAAITDHAYLKPATVSLKILFSADDAPLVETYQKLRDLQASREPFDVITGKRQYKNMLFKSISQTNDALTENVLSISAQLQEVLIASVEVVNVPARSKQRHPGKTGKTENAGSKSAQLIDPNKASAFKKFVQVFLPG